MSEQTVMEENTLASGSEVIITKRSHRNVWNKETKDYERSAVFKLEGVFVRFDKQHAIVRVRTPIGEREMKFFIDQVEAKS